MRWIRWPFRAKRSDRDFDEEIRAHLALEAEQLVREGVPRRDADVLARRAFGNVARTQERFHDSQRARWIEQLSQDVQYAFRQLRRSPGMATVAIATLALGIGANAVMFGVVDRMLLRPPPGIAAPGELRRLYFRQRSPYEVPGHEIYTASVVSYPLLVAMRAVPAFAGVAGLSAAPETFGRGAAAQQVDGEQVTANYFQLLGARPALGRFFTAGDERAPVVVLGYGFWQRQFGGASDVVGKTIHLVGSVLTVIGVAERDFHGIDLNNVDVWTPLGAIASPAGRRWETEAGSLWIRSVARVAPGISDARAASEATVIFRRMARDVERGQQWPHHDTLGVVIPGSVIAARGPDDTPRDARVSLWLAGVAGMVLLIACANVANLLLARAVRRRREIAVRLALGVGRARLVRQLLTETIVLAALAAVVAVIVATWGGRAVSAVLLPASVASSSAIDWRVVGFTAAAALVAAFLAGMTPAIQATRVDVADTLSAGARDSGRRSRLQRALLITQAAFSVVLLVGAGLFVRSLQRVRGVDVGIDLSKVLLVQLNLRGADLDTLRIPALVERAVDRARRAPGVTHVTAPSGGIPKRSASGMSVKIAGRDTLPPLPNGGPYNNVIDDEYFSALGARITRGRGIVSTDMRGAGRVVVVNETLAKYYWPNVSPIGACVVLGGDKACTEVVGVVQDVMMFGMINDERGQIYVPRSHPEFAGSTPDALIVRTTGDAHALAATLHRDLQSLDADMPFVNVQAYEELVAPDLRSWRLGAAMFGAFGALALVIAAVGLYGVLAYAVSQRTREMGVRIALGAGTLDVVRLVTVDGMRVVGIGVALGTLAAFGAGRFVAPMLYQTSPHDPAIFAGVAITLGVVALAASLVPAWRAARVDPSVALRAD